jgi:hypothetical protein
VSRGEAAGGDVFGADDGVGVLAGELAEDLGDVDRVVGAPLGGFLFDPAAGDEQLAQVVGDVLAGEVRGVERRDADLVPGGGRVGDLLEVGGGIVGVADREDAAAVVGGQRVGGDPQLLGDAARLVEDDQHAAGVDALEGGLVVVGGLAAEADELAVVG